jgi:3-oxoacyl-[acyl-carrier-protein] synthase II
MSRPPTGRRVVITGFGCVSPLGATADETWSAAIAGRSGVGAIQRFDTADFSVKIAAQAPDGFDLGDLPAKEVRRLDRYTLLALAAAREALCDAGLDPDGAQSDRCGTGSASGVQVHENRLERPARRQVEGRIRLAKCGDL